MVTKHFMSALGKTWIFDLDGTLVKHNGYKTDGTDSWLEGALDFLKSIPEKDCIIFLTSRSDDYRTITESFLNSYHIRYNAIIYNIPYGERILINDKKRSGLTTAIAINSKRDKFMDDIFIIDDNL